MKTLTWEDFIKSVNNLQKYNEETGDMEDVSPYVIETTLKVARYLQEVDPEDIPWDVYVFEDTVFIEWIDNKVQKRLEIEDINPEFIDCTLCKIVDCEYIHTHFNVPT
jgi:hypothetical protein